MKLTPMGSKWGVSLWLGLILCKANPSARWTVIRLGMKPGTTILIEVVVVNRCCLSVIGTAMCFTEVVFERI